MALRPASSPPVVHQENISSLPPPAAAGVFAVVPPLPVEGTAVAAGASVPQAVRSIDNTARRLIIIKVLRLRFMRFLLWKTDPPQESGTAWSRHRGARGSASFLPPYRDRVQL